MFRCFSPSTSIPSHGRFRPNASTKRLPNPRPFLRFATLVIGLAIVGVVFAGTTQAAFPVQESGSPERPVDEAWFTANILPLLETHCLECHSHAANNMEGGLALDSRSGWAVGGDSGPAIIPSDPAASLLLQAIRHTGDVSMPPDDKLTDQQIRLFEKWINSGAPDPRQLPTADSPKTDPLDWWSLQPLTSPPLPAASSTDPDLHPIDRFIEAKLAEHDLALSPVAEPRQRIRRLFHALHGLPPQPDQLDAWVQRLASSSTNQAKVWRQLIDELLQSPRHGERWARHWLDTVHFADTHGCEHDVLRPHAWPYRDYVIDSLNADKPYAQFVREQLAADHFHPERGDLIPALGFISAGPLELSRAGTAPVTFDYLDRDDIVAQVMAALTSTTANCARCHDHKFDPISQEDYYALQAVFAGGGKGDRPYDPDPQTRQRRILLRQQLARVQQRDPSLLQDESTAAQIHAFETGIAKQSVWIPLDLDSVVSQQGATLTRLPDGSILASGKNPPTDTYVLVGSGQGTGSGQAADRKLEQVSAIRLDVLPHDSLPTKGPGRCVNGNLHLNEVELLLTRGVGTDQESTTPLPIAAVSADWNQEGWTIEHAIDQNPQSAWGIYPRVGQPHHAVFQLREPVQVGPETRLTLRLHQTHGGSHLIGRFQVYVTDSTSDSVRVLPEAVRQALSVPAEQRSTDQQLELATFVLAASLEKQMAELPAEQRVYAWSRYYSHAKPHDQPLPPKTVHVLKRGNIERPGPVAVPGALSVLSRLPSRFAGTIDHHESFRRAALANWITDHDNPLFWRSIVNRVWAYHFGQGLCPTPNDFGRMGGKPSHPELLDWLAIWFRDEARGSLKELHRLILTSRTWQQASLPSDPEMARRAASLDASNRWLWKQRLRRLDAESFRDSILQISGAIDWTMGGPGVEQFLKSKGQQSTPQLDYAAFDWNSPLGHRRAIYRVVWRGIADPFMESLDFPDLGLLNEKRESSSSALQALSTFNNNFVLHFSEVLAQRMTDQHPDLPDQVREVCRLIWLRPPTPDEQAALVAHARQHSLAAVCRVLFNSNEFMFLP